MARRRYYRRSVRVVAAKKKWASNFINFGLTTGIKTTHTLVENSSESATPTPVIVKCGNFKVQGDIGLNSTDSVSLATYMTLYILFVPQGWADVDIETIPQKHPEWIMGWTVVDMPISSPGKTAGNKFSITSRLKRNLNSGDKVVIYMSAVVTGGSTATIVGNAQFFTCSN